MKKINFDKTIQLDEPIEIPSIKLLALKSFYKDWKKNQPLYGCEDLEELISLIPEDCAISENPCKLFLPVNKKGLLAKKLLPYINEKIIDLNTMEGKKEAGKRLAILAHLLSLQPHGEVIEDGGLDSGGAGIFIGDFLFPDGKISYLVTFFKDDQGKNGSWWFNLINNHEISVDHGYWFAFSPKLQKLINSSSKISY